MWNQNNSSSVGAASACEPVEYVAPDGLARVQCGFYKDVAATALGDGTHRHRHGFVPGVAFGLEGVAGGKFLGGFLGFAHETVALVSTEQIVGAFAVTADCTALSISTSRSF